MNKFYVIFPTCLLIVFGVYYTQVAKPEMAAKEAAALKAEQEKEAADEAARLKIEQKAQEDARRQQEERERKDKEKQEKAKAEQEAEDKKVRDETAKLEGEAASLTKQIADEQKVISDLRAEKDKMTRAVFDGAANVELAKIDRRNAELEIQRMYDMVAQKVDDSFLTQAPPPPPAK
jgi:hypothetical protein